MRNATNYYLDLLSERHDNATDYRLSKLLGTTTQNISHYRHGRRQLGDTIARRIAELLNLHPLTVISAINAERATDSETASMWRDFAKLARHSATVGCAIFVLLIGLPSPAEASPLQGFANQGNSTAMYIM